MKSRYFTTVTFAVVCILTVQILFALVLIYVFPDWSARGQFGDMFGAVNATFSGLAFAGLIYAILLQREDLALQRSELELTRKELMRSASAQEQSEVALSAQAESSAISARLAATNFLLTEYKKELTIMSKYAFQSNDPRLIRQAELQRRVNILTEVLDSVFRNISGEE